MLERAQGYLKLPNGRALTGHSHDYKRHGTTTLFGAFEVATGKVQAAHKKRGRRKEFLDFMNEVVAAYPKKRLKVILDNLNTHTKNEEWLARHPKVTFHYTPTCASWLTAGPVADGRFLHVSRAAQGAHRCLHRALQPGRRAVRVDQGASPPAPRQGPSSQRLVIPGY